MSDKPRAVVREVDGQLVLDDPEALAVARAVAKHNCKGTLELNEERVQHFKKRVTERGDSTTEVVIVLLNVDDSLARPIADVLMPNFNWQEIRDRGEVPFARGLAGRAGLQAIVDELDTDAGKKLREIDGLAVVVVDHQVVEVFEA
jgi:hypothetical protein